jgi:hypothetical protein
LAETGRTRPYGGLHKPSANILPRNRLGLHEREEKNTTEIVGLRPAPETGNTSGAPAFHGNDGLAAQKNDTWPNQGTNIFSLFYKQASKALFFQKQSFVNSTTHHNILINSS